MIKNAGGIQDVRPSSAVTELFWQTHLQNPKRYRKDLRALAKLAELLEEEKAKERRMFERRKRERDNMQRKSQERKRPELSDRKLFWCFLIMRNVTKLIFSSRRWERWLEKAQAEKLQRVQLAGSDYVAKEEPRQ